MKPNLSHPGSFKDPSGFIFVHDEQYFRQVNSCYKDDYDFFVSSGLYQELVKKSYILPHTEEKTINAPVPDIAYKIIKPKQLTFVSYPYEWCFSQLQDAALLTLEIQKIALQFGMSLKDANAYNIQFEGYMPVFIDTLSFERYEERKPWVAYKQFCEHFFAPLCLMSQKDLRLNQLFRIFLDGIPIDIADNLLGVFSYKHLSTLLHIHMHAKSQKHIPNARERQDVEKKKFTFNAFIALIDSLKSFILKLSPKIKKSVWKNYYQEGRSYSKKAFQEKEDAVSYFLDKIHPNIIWDLGSNTGFFSRLCAQKVQRVISFDFDPVCVESQYVHYKKNKEENILPLAMDLSNPSPNLGWNLQERKSLQERSNADCVLALALVHHLAVAKNIPLISIAEFLSSITKNYCIIEFIPKDDHQIQEMLTFRKDIFQSYNKKNFEKDFSNLFRILESKNLQDSGRVIYLAKKKDLV